MGRQIIELSHMRNLVAGGLVGHLRRSAGLTQAEVAKDVGVHPSTVAYWERGHVPSGDAAVRYARLVFELETLTRR